MAEEKSKTSKKRKDTKTADRREKSKVQEVKKACWRKSWGEYMRDKITAEEMFDALIKNWESFVTGMNDIFPADEKSQEDCRELFQSFVKTATASERIFPNTGDRAGAAAESLR